MVVVSAEIDIEGMPQNVKVVRSLTKDFDNQAIEAVKKWRFEPAIKGAMPVPVITAIGLDFYGP